MTANPLIGTWRLVSWENQSVDGQVSYPFGQDTLGYLLYTPAGYMFVALMRPHRTDFVSGDLLKGSPEEKIKAAETYISYCGQYEVQGDTVIHHVELSLFPNWSGGDQERLIELAGNRLILSARPMLLEGRQQIARLVWERVARPS
jgi:Lipocalin-like domain